MKKTGGPWILGTLLLLLPASGWSRQGVEPSSLNLGYYRLSRPPKLGREYKRIHPWAYARILEGRIGKALGFLQAALAQNPGDPETWYMLALARAAQGRLDSAQEAAAQALELGLPPGRLVGGTLTGLEPLEKTSLFRGLFREFEKKPVQGPMLGSLTDRSVKVWVRTAREAQVRVVLGETSGIDSPMEVVQGWTKKERDYTLVLEMKGLKPGKKYFYSVEMGGKRGPVHAFRTFPAKGKACKLRIAFGGGAGYVPPHEKVWNTIRSFHPAALLLLGDNVYIDAPESPPLQHFIYYRRQSRPEFRRLVGEVPVFAIWDDHDFGVNDCVPGPDADDPPWKRKVFEFFRDNWANPSFGGGDARPGCWFEFRAGDIHFVMLDCRYYRTLKEKGDSTMLGPVQKKWLFDALLRAKRWKPAFTVLVSSVPWTFYAKGKSKDTWNGFREERGEIFDFLDRNGIDGVLLLSADRHRSDLWKIERKKGYPLYEFESSRLTNQHVHKTMKKALFSYNAKQSFGLVDFDTTLPDPTATYRIVEIDGKEVFNFTVKRSALVKKVGGDR